MYVIIYVLCTACVLGNVWTSNNLILIILDLFFIALCELDYPDKTWDYVLFCILMVTYALELLIWPAIVANKLMRWIRSNELSQRKRYATKAKGERLEQCLGGLLKCVSVICCNKAGGKELKNQGEMKDFASNLVRIWLSSHCVTDLSLGFDTNDVIWNKWRWSLLIMIRKLELFYQTCTSEANCWQEFKVSFI